MEIETTELQQAEIDPERQQKAREYARIRRQLSFAGMGIAAVGMLFIFWSGLDIALRDWLQPLSWQPLPGWYPLQVAAYFVILLLSYEIITFPITYYRDFVIVSAPKSQNSERGKVLPHRYGLSTMTLSTWLADLFKSLVLSLVLE